VVQTTNRGDTTPAVRPLEAQIISPPVPPSEMTDADLARGASDAIDRAAAMKEGAAEQALIAGELLMEAQHRCREKGVSFRQWLAKHWTTKSKTTALAYIKIATEVQRKFAYTPPPTQPKLPAAPPPPTPEERKGLLAHQSIRTFLADHGYGAGGTRDPKDAEDEAEEEQATIDRLTQEREDERQERKATRGPGQPAPRGGLAASSSASVDPAKIAEQAEAARRRAELRAQIEDASNRNPLVPPENPHQVGRPKPPEPAPDPEATCNAADLREIADLLDALSRDAWSALSRLNAVRFAPVHDDDGRRDAEITQAREAVAALAESAGSVAKKRGHQLRELANVEARVIGLERERRHKEAKKARRGA
jgi:hypothetical protein